MSKRFIETHLSSIKTPGDGECLIHACIGTSIPELLNNDNWDWIQPMTGIIKDHLMFEDMKERFNTVINEIKKDKSAKIQGNLDKLKIFLKQQ